MRVLGKIIVIIGGFFSALSFAYMLLIIISSSTAIVIYPMIGFFIMFLIGWIISIFGGKQRLLLISVLAFLGYMIYDGYITIILYQFSQITVMFALNFVLLFGMLLTRRRKSQKD